MIYAYFTLSLIATFILYSIATSLGVIVDILLDLEKEKQND